jgi:dihydrodipicolinate synthase/N-acetylneuraminate lyase
VRANDLATARDLQYRGVQLVEVLARYGYLSAAKELLRANGIDLGPVRLPNTDLTADARAALRRELGALGA